MPPPKLAAAPKPMSSMSTMTTLGAPSGARTENGGGASAFRALSSVIFGNTGSGTGKTVRSSVPGALVTFRSVPCGYSGLSEQPANISNKLKWTVTRDGVYCSLLISRAANDYPLFVFCSDRVGKNTRQHDIRKKLAEPPMCALDRFLPAGIHLLDKNRRQTEVFVISKIRTGTIRNPRSDPGFLR